MSSWRVKNDILSKEVPITIKLESRMGGGGGVAHIGHSEESKNARRKAAL